MKQVGVREVRQNLSALLDAIKGGQELLITEHGRPVARLVPVEPSSTNAFPDLSAFRSRMPKLSVPLSDALDEDRADRL